MCLTYNPITSFNIQNFPIHHALTTEGFGILLDSCRQVQLRCHGMKEE